MGGSDVARDVLRMVENVESELEMQRKILLQIQSQQSLWEPQEENDQKDSPHQVVIPILVIACNRVTIKRCLDKLIEYRPSVELYPIIVSQDCGHAETAEVIDSYGSQVTHLKQPDMSDISVRPEHKKFQGYYKISRHYHWALNQVFKVLSHSSVVIVEDDLEVIHLYCSHFPHFTTWDSNSLKCSKHIIYTVYICKHLTFHHDDSVYSFTRLLIFYLNCRWHQISLITSEPYTRC